MRKRIAIVGAGIGGLVAAIELAARDFDVTLLERAGGPGGKMRPVHVDGELLDAGPTVFTMRWVFDAIFEDAGASFERAVRLKPLQILARHAWSEHERLDLFADSERSADAIGAFAGREEAEGFRAFCRRAQRIYDTLETPFILSHRPSLEKLIARAGVFGLPALWRISPFTTLWRALGDDFRDPRLRQLFARYATYCGSSPFSAPATLMLIAHVEQQGVWSVQGGMHTVATALAELAVARGAKLVYGADVDTVEVAAGRASGVTTKDGLRLEADAVLVNGDANAVAAGLLGNAVSSAVAGTGRSDRSLSAIKFAMRAEAEGFPLTRHNVFFSSDYAEEFATIFGRGRLPAEPTVYVCAQDRGDEAAPAAGVERLLCLVNAPANGDSRTFEAAEVRECEENMFRLLQRCGLRIAARPEAVRVTTPSDFERLYPGTGGSLYGRASHGWKASFSRPGARTRIPGLYLAGGSTHPGAGVPMAALSGRMAAASLVEDLASTARSRGTVMRGGTSTR